MTTLLSWTWRWTTVDVLFEPRDLWVGVFWNRAPVGKGFVVYLCLVPLLPVKIEHHW